jgi:hypothetical protein
MTDPAESEVRVRDHDGHALVEADAPEAWGEIHVDTGREATPVARHLELAIAEIRASRDKPGDAGRG